MLSNVWMQALLCHRRVILRLTAVNRRSTVYKTRNIIKFSDPIFEFLLNDFFDLTAELLNSEHFPDVLTHPKNAQNAPKCSQNAKKTTPRAFIRYQYLACFFPGETLQPYGFCCGFLCPGLRRPLHPPPPPPAAPSLPPAAPPPAPMPSTSSQQNSRKPSIRRNTAHMGCLARRRAPEGRRTA